jgi:hypothetical protein
VGSRSTSSVSGDSERHISHLTNRLVGPEYGTEFGIVGADSRPAVYSLSAIVRSGDDAILRRSVAGLRRTTSSLGWRLGADSAAAMFMLASSASIASSLTVVIVMFEMAQQ